MWLCTMLFAHETVQDEQKAEGGFTMRSIVGWNGTRRGIRTSGHSDGDDVRV